MPDQHFAHFLLTKFNVRIEERASEEWLLHRLNYFEALCRASVVTQTEQHFTWLVYFDAERDAWFQDEIDRLSQAAFEPIWVDGPLTSQKVAADLASRSDSPWLITTRVDNDDALATDFIGQIQAQFAYQTFQFINFQRGLQLSDEGGLYHVSIPSNPFMTLVEKRTSELPVGVYVDWHNRLSAHGPMKQIAAHPMWVQMVHSRNISNTISGIRANPILLDRFFDIELQATPLTKLQLGTRQVTTAMLLGWHRVGRVADRLRRRTGRTVD